MTITMDIMLGIFIHKIYKKGKLHKTEQKDLIKNKIINIIFVVLKHFHSAQNY